MATAISVFCIGVCLSSAIVSGAVPLDVITGQVLDEYGNPVPDATVTLRQDGQLWQPNEKLYPGCQNPQTTNNSKSNEGVFLFALLYPGHYTITAEKYGYTGFTGIDISNSTIHAPYQIKIAINNFDAVLTQEQATYHGSITVVVWDRSHREISHYANVSLWRDGQLVRLTNNPQKATEGKYSFKHLAPGKYNIRVEEFGFTGRLSIENKTVDVGSGPVATEVVMQYIAKSRPVPTWPPNVSRSPSPSSSSSPSPMPTQTPVTTPAPSPDLAMIFSSIAIALLAHKARKHE